MIRTTFSEAPDPSFKKQYKPFQKPKNIFFVSRTAQVLEVGSIVTGTDRCTLWYTIVAAYWLISYTVLPPNY